MSVTFPTLEAGTVQVNTSPAFDASLRSQAEDGLVISRRKFTGNKKKFQLLYRALPAADKALLETMQNNAGVGADTITWTNQDPNDITAYVVRLTPEGIVFDNREENYGFYTAKFTFIEA